MKLEFILFIAFFLFFLIQIFYYTLVFIRTIFYKKKELKKIPQEPVSIIICAKNEAENLENFLTSILEQNYPKFEVIVVNDGSTDDTKEVLEKYQEKYSNLYTTFIKKINIKHSKKLAVTVGIKAAKYEWLLFTDADCFVKTKNWLSSMQKNFTKKTEFVIAYGAYEKTSSFLNKIIRFDTVFIAIQYFNFALWKLPYMGVGRNLAHRKTKFFEYRPFDKNMDLISGDDDLYVNEFANSKNTKIELNQESFTYSKAQTKFFKWIAQKQRHLTTGKRYKLKHKILLGGEFISRFLFYLLFFTLFFLKFKIEYLLILFFVRAIVQFLIIFFNMKHFKEKDLIYFVILFDIILLLINFIIIFINFFKRKHKWK